MMSYARGEREGKKEGESREERGGRREGRERGGGGGRAGVATHRVYVDSSTKIKGLAINGDPPCVDTCKHMTCAH